MMPSEHSAQSHHSTFINELDGPRYYSGSTDVYGQLIMNNPYTMHQPTSVPPLLPPPPISQHQPTPPSHSIRTVYLGNISIDISVSDIMDLVKTGPIQAIRPLPEKNGLFITFVDASAAAQFYHESTHNHLTIHGHELKIGWGKPSSLTNSIQTALQNGASRNVYLGLLDDTITEQELRQDLSRFGHIEQVKIIPEKRIAFVHFLCITNAVKCVNTLPTESHWQTKRVNFGKDRCAGHHQQQQQQQKLIMLPPHHHNSTLHSNSFQQQQQNSAQRYTTTYDLYTGVPVVYHHHHHQQQHTNQHHQHHPHHPLGSVANRTIYLGNIHPDTTSEDICNVIRGGILSQIRFMPDKHIAFITFVDPILAENFFNSTECLVIKNRRLKLGWGKPSALPITVLNAVQNGGSRNVYIGNIDDLITEEKLKHDFSEYGDIELVNTLKEKNCAFVNFTSIAGAVRAIEGIRSKEEYKKFRINYGKDRCGNPPRFQQQQQQQARESLQHHYLDDDDNEEELINTTNSTSNNTTPTITTTNANNHTSTLIKTEKDDDITSSLPVDLIDLTQH